MFHYAFCSSGCEMLAQFLLLTFFCSLSVGLSNWQMLQIIKTWLFYHLNKYSFDFLNYFSWTSRGKKKKTAHEMSPEPKKPLYHSLSGDIWVCKVFIPSCVHFSLSLFTLSSIPVCILMYTYTLKFKVWDKINIYTHTYIYTLIEHIFYFILEHSQVTMLW